MGRVEAHNKEIRYKAEYRANEMTIWPSPLEGKMEDILRHYGIRYESQKIFYIYADDGWIVRYYIADFYVPEKKVIIEVDGKFHDKQKQHDRDRTRTIQEHYPGVEVVRVTGKDLSDSKVMHGFMHRIMFDT